MERKTVRECSASLAAFRYVHNASASVFRGGRSGKGERPVGRTTFEAASAAVSSAAPSPPSRSVRACTFVHASSRRKLDPFCHAWDVKYVSVASGPRRSPSFLAALRDRVSAWNVDGPSSSLGNGAIMAVPRHPEDHGYAFADRFEARGPRLRDVLPRGDAWRCASPSMRLCANFHGARECENASTRRRVTRTRDTRVAK